MSDLITKTQRRLDLIAFLVTRGVSASIEGVMEGAPAHTSAWTECAE